MSERKPSKYKALFGHLACGTLSDKKMLKTGKENDREVILKWITGVRNHLYWCATSTKEGFSDMILAKWKSFTNHVANRHEEHPNHLYPYCAHGELGVPCDWIKIGNY